MSKINSFSGAFPTRSSGASDSASAPCSDASTCSAADARNADVGEFSGLSDAVAAEEGARARIAADIHDDDRGRWERPLTHHLDGSAPSYACSMRVRHRDGRWAWVHDRGKVHERDEDGRALKIAGTISPA